MTPDPGGGKRAAIQNQCSFIGSGDGHSHCPAHPALPAKTPAAHARPAWQPGKRALPAALARTSVLQQREPRARESQHQTRGAAPAQARGDDVTGSQDDRDAPPRLHLLADRRAASEVSGCRGPLVGGRCSPRLRSGPEHRGFESCSCLSRRCSRALSARGAPGPERGDPLGAPSPGSGTEPDDECRARQRSKVKEEPSEGRGMEMADCLGGNGGER